MSRRQPSDDSLLPKRTKYKSLFSQRHEQRQTNESVPGTPFALPYSQLETTSLTDVSEALQSPKEASPGYYTEEAVFALYRENPGRCPLCMRPLMQGYHMHILKCLHIANSKIAST